MKATKRILAAASAATLAALIFVALVLGGGSADAAPRHFGVVSFCDHGNRVYYASSKHGVAITLAKGDLSCRTDVLPTRGPVLP
jgi:hypothetical protein